MCEFSAFYYGACGCEYANVHGALIVHGAWLHRLRPHIDTDILPFKKCLQRKLMDLETGRTRTYETASMSAKLQCTDVGIKQIMFLDRPCYQCFHQLPGTKSASSIRESMRKWNMFEPKSDGVTEERRQMICTLFTKFSQTLTTTATSLENRKYVGTISLSARDDLEMVEQKRKSGPERSDAEKEHRRNQVQQWLAEHYRSKATKQPKASGRKDSAQDEFSLQTPVLPRPAIVPKYTCKSGALDLRPPGTWSYTALRYPPDHGMESSSEAAQPPRSPIGWSTSPKNLSYGGYGLEPAKHQTLGSSLRPEAAVFVPHRQFEQYTGLSNMEVHENHVISPSARVVVPVLIPTGPAAMKRRNQRG